MTICADPTNCCKELTRVWAALGITTTTGKSASEHVVELVRDLKEAEYVIKQYQDELRWPR